MRTMSLPKRRFLVHRWLVYSGLLAIVCGCSAFDEGDGIQIVEFAVTQRELVQGDTLVVVAKVVNTSDRPVLVKRMYRDIFKIVVHDREGNYVGSTGYATAGSSEGPTVSIPRLWHGTFEERWVAVVPPGVYVVRGEFGPIHEPALAESMAVEIRVRSASLGGPSSSGIP